MVASLLVSPICDSRNAVVNSYFFQYYAIAYYEHWFPTAFFLFKHTCTYNVSALETRKTKCKQCLSGNESFQPPQKHRYMLLLTNYRRHK